MKAWLRTPWVGVLALAVAGSAPLGHAKDNVRLVVTDEPYLQFPYEAQNDGIYSGDVQVVVSIDSEGRVADSLIMIGYTHPALRTAVEQALPHYRFKPVLVAGKPSMVRVGLTFNFSITGLILSGTSLDALQNRLRQMERGPYVSRLAQTARELDQPLAVRRTVQPLNVPGAGTITLDFYIDETGRARMPAVRAGTDRPELADAATEALLQWEFAPPKRGGAPVIVRASQQFVFQENG